MRGRRSNLLCMLVGWGPSACGGSDGTGPGPPAVAVATVQVEPGQAQLVFGESVQLSATLRDASGATLSGRSISFTSTNQAVATVSSSGLARAVGKGQAEISATSEGISGSSSLTVILVDFEPEQDTELSGLQLFANVNIADGVKVSATGDLDLLVEGIVQIAGILEADCDGVAVKGGADVTIPGTIQNDCNSPDAPGPTLSIAASGALDLTGGKVISSGLIQAINGLADIFSAQSLAPATAERLQGGPCVFREAEVRQLESEAGSTPPGIEILCEGDVIFSGTTIVARNGADGASAESVGAGEVGASASSGGVGGFVRIEADGDVDFLAGSGGTTISLGSGGNGGDATATATSPGGSATASAGDGGESGALSVVADGSKLSQP